MLFFCSALYGDYTSCVSDIYNGPLAIGDDDRADLFTSLTG